MPATPVFSWFPDANLQVQVEPRVMSAKFGDGYEQRAPIGLNTVLDKWSLTFTGPRSLIDLIDAFLRERKGAYSFTWKNPDEVTGRYICRSWSKSRERSVKVTLTATFEQVAEV